MPAPEESPLEPDEGGAHFAEAVGGDLQRVSRPGARPRRSRPGIAARQFRPARRRRRGGLRNLTLLARRSRREINRRGCEVRKGELGKEKTNDEQGMMNRRTEKGTEYSRAPEGSGQALAGESQAACCYLELGTLNLELPLVRDGAGWKSGIRLAGRRKLLPLLAGFTKPSIFRGTAGRGSSRPPGR